MEKIKFILEQAIKNQFTKYFDDIATSLDASYDGSDAWIDGYAQGKDTIAFHAKISIPAVAVIQRDFSTKLSLAFQQAHTYISTKIANATPTACFEKPVHILRHEGGSMIKEEKDTYVVVLASYVVADVEGEGYDTAPTFTV